MYDTVVVFLYSLKGGSSNVLLSKIQHKNRYVYV